MLRLPLKYRITAALFGLSAIILAVVLSQVLSQYFEGSRDQVVQQEQATLELLGEFARLALLTTDYEIFQPQMERVSSLPGVSAVVLADDRGIIVVASKPALVGQPLLLRGSGEEGEWQAMPLENVAGSLGTLAARFSDDALMALHRQVRRLAVGWSLGGLILIALSSVLVSHLLTRRLVRITRAAATVAGGDLSALAEVAGRDEVAELGRVFDSMVQTIKEVRACMEEREQYLSLTLDSIGDAVIATDVGGRITRMNPVAEALTGWRLSEVVGRPLPEVFRIINVQTREPVADPVEKALSTGKVVSLDNHTALISRDGAEYHIDDSGAPITDSEGNLLGVVLVFHDITGRKQAEEAFQTLIKSTVGSAGQEFFDKTVGNLVEWLGADCVIIGEIIDKENVKALAMMLDGEIIRRYSYKLPGTPCESVAMKGFCFYPEGIIKLFPDDRDLVELEAEGYAGAPLRDKSGNPIGVICAITRRKLSLPPMAKDVFEIIAAKTSVEVERRRVEEELKDSESKLREAQQIACLGYWELDMVSNTLYWSDEIYRIFDLEPREFGASYEAFLDMVHPEDREFVDKAFTGSIKNKTTYDIVHRLLMKDGTVKYVNERCKSEYDENGHPLRSVGTTLDITELKRTEEELQEYREHLEEKVKKRTAEIEAKNIDLERFNRLFVDRELRVKELRDRVKELELQVSSRKKEFEF